MTADKIILGKNEVYSTDCSKTGLNNNVIVCGGSGSGKTMSVTEPMFLEAHNTSIIATVTKRRIVEKYSPMFAERGYVVEDLNFIHPEFSTVSYDPMMYIQSSADITFLAESIVCSDPRKENSVADPYWDNAAVSLLSAEIAYIQKKIPSATFADVIEFHNSLTFREGDGRISSNFDRIFQKLEEEEPNCFAVSCWKSFGALPVRTAGCVFGALNTQIDRIFSKELLQMFKMRNKLDFKKIADRRTVLFVSTSAVNPALNSFINMFYSQAFKQLFEYAEDLPDGKLPIPVRVICDDFATGCRILNFPEYISIFREKQISVTLLIQSESQLENMYGSYNATTIINNCDTYLFMGSMDLKTGRNVSERINLPLDEVLYMPIGREFIFRRGQRPVITQRYDIVNDERYCDITAAYEKKIAERKKPNPDTTEGFDKLFRKRFDTGKTG